MTGVGLERSTELVRCSPVWNGIFLRVKRLAPLNIPILITGETGTGKYLVAKKVHEMKRLEEFAFVHVDCPTLPDGLFESELFGSEPGAFTGAQRKEGLITRAEFGTLLLDEISCLSFSTQAKLLRLLDHKKYRRLGNSRDYDSSARIIATTNENLEQLAKEQKFHADLFYRLDEARIRIPPLRERKEDIIPLIEYFLRTSQLNPMGRIVLKGDHLNSIVAIQGYPWPGNAREVRNVVNSSLLEMEAEETELSTVALAEILSGRLANLAKFSFQSERLESEKLDDLFASQKRKIEEVLSMCRGNKVKAAKMLGMCRSTLAAKAARLGVHPRYGKNV